MQTPTAPDIAAAIDNANASTNISTRCKRKRPTELTDSLIQEIKCELKEQIDSSLKSFIDTQTDQSKNILITLKELKESTNNLNSTMAFLCEENTFLKDKISILENQAKTDKEQLLIMEYKLEEKINNDRKTSIEIKNIPLRNETKNDLYILINNLCKNIDIHLEKSDIKDIIKINKNRNEKSTVIVEFTNIFIKNNVMKAAKKFNVRNKTNKLTSNHLGMKTAETPIYITESLTPTAARLYFLARDLKRTRGFKYCWTNYGKVYVRQEDNSPIIPIKSESQIQQLVNK